MIRLRHAARRLLRARAFSLSAMLTLALGIGGATTVFTLVNGVLLQPLAYAHAEALVDLSHTLNVSGITSVDQSDATFLLYRQRNHVFTDVGAYRSEAVNLDAPPRGSSGDASASPPERVSAALVSASVFRVLGVSPGRGRGLAEADDAPGAVPVVVIAHQLWRRKFGGDPGIIGRRISVDGVEREVVGVMPESFSFPSAETTLWLPLLLDPVHTNSAAFDYRGIARLRGGATLSSATAELERLLPDVPAVFPGRLTLPAIKVTHMQPVVRPLRDVIVGNVSRVLWIVLGAAGVLLMVACANVANLFLARAEGRQRELAVRRALGAGRWSLLADFFSEAAIVSGAGGALAMVCAALGIHLLRATGAAASIPRLADVGVDGAVFAATAIVTVLTAAIVSAATVMRSGSASLSAVLMASGSGASGGRSRSTARRALVTVQVGLALVLLAGAGLLARSFSGLLRVDPGFDARHALSFRLSLPAATYPGASATARVVLDALDALRALPGVQSAGVATKLPLDDESRQDSAVFVEDHPIPKGSIPGIHEIVFVTPDYFRAMGIPLLAGRAFEPPDPNADAAHAQREVIVSAAFADRYWKGEQAVGKRIRMNPADPWSTVVGVVRGVRDVGLDQPPAQVVYVPLVSIDGRGMPWAPRDVAFVIRATGAADPATLSSGVRRALQAVAPSLPVYRMRPVHELLSASVARTTFTLLVLGVAAVVAMAVGAMGIYGVIAYLVSLRTRELGVRLALGATPANVRGLVVRHALVDASLGVAAGLAGAAALTRVLAAMLYDVSPLDPVTLLAASALLLLAALAASWVPARRAAALDPVSALRTE